MVIAEAVLTFILGFLILFGSILTIFFSTEEKNPFLLLLGILGVVLSLLAIIFQGVALAGTVLIITEAIFTFLLCLGGLITGLLGISNDFPKIGFPLIIFSIVTTVFQAIVLGILL